MDAMAIQESITQSQMFDLLSHLDGDPKWLDDEVIIAKTICHNGDSHKLYYYENSKRFTCYTGSCGYGFSVYDLIMQVNKCTFIEAFNYLKGFFGIISASTQPIPSNERVETSFFKRFQEDEIIEVAQSSYSPDVLNCFYDIYHASWLEDGISAHSMWKYHIKYSILTNQIIIPHFDIYDKLIGVRVRNLDEDLVEDGKKYMPLIFNGEMYNHETSKYLYGLNFVRENIKKHKKIILFESEKSCMQVDTMYPEDNIAVALSGSNFSEEQAQAIRDLDVEEVIIALDKEFVEVGSRKEQLYQQEIRNIFINKLLPHHKVSIIWDWDGLLEEKDSPSDKGKDIFTKLYEDRLMITA